MSSVIKVENLSKQYRLGEVGTGTFRDDFKRWRYRLMGREDPFLKIGEENDRNKKAESDYVWALKDINFEVEQGDVVGIIGRNGAGKSTLLKILSRTTAPTTGSVKVKGRIASLLEVGTGFHGELSGRENIYLNGAIMGLRKWEIDKKLDEIIDFAGVEKYLDTPVKRYSSGMYVRLAFAVAAHLEPDILIVDEVLAVGDAEFQKKCLGKMKDVSQGQGRTVLFVSHNLGAIFNLAKQGFLLESGCLKKNSKISDVIHDYNSLNGSQTREFIEMESEDSRLLISQIKINDSNINEVFLKNAQKLIIEIEGEILEDLIIDIEVQLFDLNSLPIAFYSPGHYNGNSKKFYKGKFSIQASINLPEILNKGHFLLNISLTDPGKIIYAKTQNHILLSYEGIYCKTGHQFESNKAGIFLIKD